MIIIYKIKLHIKYIKHLNRRFMNLSVESLINLDLMSCLSRNVGCAEFQLGISTLLLLMFCSVVGVVAMDAVVCATGSTLLFFSGRLSITVPFFCTVA